MFSRVAMERNIFGAIQTVIRPITLIISLSSDGNIKNESFSKEFCYEVQNSN